MDVYYKMFNLILKKTKINYYFKVGMLFFLIILSVSVVWYYDLSNTKICSICLIIEDPVNGEILYTKRVKPGDTFVYTYTHSLEKLPVCEMFMIAENLDIILIETKLSSLFGSGIFPTPEEKINFTKDEIFIKSNRHFKSLPVRVAYFYEQQIIFRGEKIVLSQLAAKGELVRIYIKER